jgi:Sec-independent protein translocase protein TatA
MAPTDEELHYKSLTDYFKNLVRFSTGTLGIIVAVGFFIFYSKLSDVQSEANKSINNAKSEATREIDSIRQQSAQLAINTAREKIDEAFKSNNITKIVEEAATRQVGTALEKQVRDELNRRITENVDRRVNDVLEQVSILNKIADYGYKMHIGRIDALSQLLKIQNTSPHETERKWAKELIETIAADYDSVNARGNGDVAPPILSLPRDSSQLIELAVMINTAEDLNPMASAFYQLRTLTRINFKTFDIEHVNQWFRENNLRYK